MGRIPTEPRLVVGLLAGLLLVAGIVWTARPGTGAPPDDEAVLVDALLRAEAEGADALEVRRRTGAVVARRPELVPDLARAFARLESPAILRQVARLLARHPTVPAVSRTFREVLARSGDDAHPARQAAAAHALTGGGGGPRLARSLADRYLDRATPASVRAAAAFALVDRLGDLPPASRERLRLEARRTARTSGDGARAVRVESIGLLDRERDRALLRRVLETTADARVGLAAARVLLGPGGREPGAPDGAREVLDELDRLARTDDVPPALRSTLTGAVARAARAVARSRPNEGVQP